MKQLLTLCFMTLSLTGWGQLHFALEDLEVNFSPTTIDSLSTESVIVFNSLSVPQSVSFIGLDLPFSVESTNFEIPANDTTSFIISFNPASVQNFTDSLIMVGDVFGSDTLILNGEGTLPAANLLDPLVDFETVSINSSHTATFQIENSGIGTLVIGAISSSDIEFSCSGDVEIAEGDTATFTASFYTELAADYTGQLTIQTTDPFQPEIYVDLQATAISEVGGTLCGNLTTINSPYVFIEDVIVPTECTLIIEPGVVVDLNGFVLNVQGNLQSVGTAESRITIENGQVQLTQDNYTTSYTDYSNNASLNLVNRETVYLEDFEGGAQPFRCTSPQWNGNNYNTSGDWSYGCEDFVNTQSDTWASNGIRSVYFNSYRYNGELELDSPPTSVSSGLYQWSFLYKNQRLDDANRLIAYYKINSGNWIEFYSSPLDGYEQSSEQFAGFSEFFEVPDNATVNIKIIQTAYSSCRYYSQSYIDDIRLDKVSTPPLEAYLFNNQATLGGSSTGASNGAAVAGASNALGGTGTCIQIKTGEGQATSYWVSRPISVHSDRLFLDFWESRTTADQNCWYYTHYRVNEGDWQLLRDQRDMNCGNGSMETHDWEHRNYIIEDLDFGDQVEFQLLIEAYDIGNPIYRDVTMYIDEFRITEDFSQPISIKTTGTTLVNVERCEIVGDVLSIANDMAFISDYSSLEGLFIEGENATVSLDSCSARNIDMAYSGSYCNLSRSSIEDLTGNGIYLGTQAVIDMHDCIVQNCGGSGITVGSNSQVNLDYSFLINNGGDGAELGLGSSIIVNNSMVAYNLGFGVNSAGSADIEYSVIRGNGKQGLVTTQFSTIDNSIFWFNDGVPQITTENVYAISYSNVQGINALLTSSSFAWGDGCIGTDPVFVDDDSHLDAFSPCVDGGKPWEQDAHIPYGLGSTRADMGMYGGPDNAFWGGQAPPDGAVTVTSVFDIPEDEGGFVGIHFTASPFDFGGLGFNVTHYSIWRDLDIGSDVPTAVESGNWEQIGTVPAQGFDQYGYTAETLIDQLPGEDACLTSFVVIAHTTEDNIYWISDVGYVCSVDNLAPEVPVINGMVEDNNGDIAVLLSWDEVEAEDYSYTDIFGVTNGFSDVIYGDTLAIDPSISAGETYEYGAVHVDIHGNISDTSYVTVTVPGGEDRIPLVAGWNLVSIDRHPESLFVSEVLSSLNPGNVIYVTGFESGALFYDANGPTFLNTLQTIEGGRGYWMKLNAADTLVVPGLNVYDSELPALSEGWNLTGYVDQDPILLETYYSEGLESGALQYVTSFNETGTVLYNPEGMPFLNTLTELENAKGYWVKWNDESLEGMVISDEPEPNPNYMIVNGVSNISEGSIEVLNERGVVISRLTIANNGWILTEPIYGDDSQTMKSEGCFEGELLTFRSNGILAKESMTFSGNMAHEKLNLTFDKGMSSCEAIPNPASYEVTLTGSSIHTGECVWRILDSKGTGVKVVEGGTYMSGFTRKTIDINDLSSGMYTIEFMVNGRFIQRSRLQIVR